jgi:hypothetical protein
MAASSLFFSQRTYRFIFTTHLQASETQLQLLSFLYALYGC